MAQAISKIDLLRSEGSVENGDELNLALEDIRKNRFFRVDSNFFLLTSSLDYQL